MRVLSTAGTTSCQGRETELNNWEEIGIIRNFTIYIRHALLLGLQLAVVLYYVHAWEVGGQTCWKNGIGKREFYVTLTMSP